MKHATIANRLIRQRCYGVKIVNIKLVLIVHRFLGKWNVGVYV